MHVRACSAAPLISIAVSVIVVIVIVFVRRAGPWVRRGRQAEGRAAGGPGDRKAQRGALGGRRRCPAAGGTDRGFGWGTRWGDD